MALAGVGVDIFEIARMERALRRHPRLATRVFTEQEQQYCNSKARPAQHYACRFAAREAVLKALGKKLFKWYLRRLNKVCSVKGTSLKGYGKRFKGA